MILYEDKLRKSAQLPDVDAGRLKSMWTDLSAFPTICHKVRAMCVKCAQRNFRNVTNDTYSKWRPRRWWVENRTPFLFLTHISFTLWPKCPGRIATVVVENTHGLLAASHSHVKPEVVSQRVVLWLEPVVVSLLTLPSATVIVLKASPTVL